MILRHADLAPYRWVRPPREVAEGNVPPRPRVAEVTIGPGADVWTEDLQVLVALPEGVVEAPAVEVTIAPVDPETLAAVPDGMVADGNAYRISLAGVPDAAVLDRAGRLTMRVPHPATSILFSTDGEREQGWTTLVTRPDGDAYEAAFARPGVYLAVTDHDLAGGGGDGGGFVGFVAITAVAVAVLAVLALVARRRRA